MGRSGGDRLSRALRHSTMGAGVFNGRVRDGIGFWARRSGHQTGASQFVWDLAVQGAATAGVLFGKHVVAVVALWRGRPLVFVVAASSASPAFAAAEPVRTRITRAIKPIGRLVPVGSTRRRACTPGLSTWSSSTALKGGLVLRGVSRLDAFSGYPVRT